METFLHEYGLALLTAIVASLLIIISIKLSSSVDTQLTNLLNTFITNASSSIN